MSCPKTAQAAMSHRGTLTGIGLMCAAVACFACTDTMAKYLMRSYDPLQIVWVRNIAAFIVVLPFVNPWTAPEMLRTRRPVLQIGRSALSFLTALFYFFALQHLQLDQLTAILFSSPLFIAILSGPVLGEWLGPRRWAAVIVGFLGIIVIARPGWGEIHPAMLLAVAGSVCFGLSSISARLLSRTDSSATTLFYSNVVGTVLLAPMMIGVWSTPSRPADMLVMAAIGISSASGNFLLIAAYRLAPAGILASYVYTQLIWAILLGYVVFGNAPHLATLAGAWIVVASGLYLLYRERT